jgi:hypothetical protein
MKLPTSRQIRLFSLAALLLLAPTARAAAQVVYDNGTPNVGIGLVITSPISWSDDFTLSSGASLGSFSWYAISNQSNGPATLTNSYTWRIFSDAAGQPGALVSSGTEVGAVGTKTSYTFGAQNDYLFTAALGGLPLSAGTYWLAIGGSTPQFANWAVANTQGNAHVSSADGATGTFTEGGPYAAAFSISAVTAAPEPASLTLVASGLLGLAGAARRKRNSRAA